MVPKVAGSNPVFHPKLVSLSEMKGFFVVLNLTSILSIFDFSELQKKEMLLVYLSKVAKVNFVLTLNY